MTNFVLVYKGAGMPEGEAAQKAAMDAWMQWFGSLGEAVVDGGNPFGPAKTVMQGGTVTDGGSGLTGYTIIKAESLEAAVELTKTCPVLMGDNSVEVYETMPM